MVGRVSEGGESLPLPNPPRLHRSHKGQNYNHLSLVYRCTTTYICTGLICT